VLGGTFDPIHVGHLIVAEEARARFHLDQVVFVPARLSPLKLQGTFAAATHRFYMVQLAIEDNPSFRVSRVDLDRRGPSFTVDTLRAIKAASDQHTELHFIMGADSLCTLKSWRLPGEIVRLARIIAVARPGYELDLDGIERDVPGISQVTDVITAVQLGISSTDIRARLRQGLPIRYQVPASVEAYIHEHHLYAGRRTRAPRRSPTCC
jgi:nicotinate-nucleotide adenylyltransferase